MLAVDMPEEKKVDPPAPCQRRTLRPRKPQNLNLSELNRRCSLKPKKRTFDEMETEEQIKEYYLDKTVKKHTDSLETIFEEKDDLNQTTICMSNKRFKRRFQFSCVTSAGKLKKRRDKVKRIFGSKLNYKKTVSMQALLDKLSGLSKDLSTNSSNEIK